MPPEERRVSQPLSDVNPAKMDRYWAQFLRSPKEIKLVRLEEVLNTYVDNQTAIENLTGINHAIAESLLKFLRKKENKQLLVELGLQETDDGDASFRFNGRTILAYPRFFISFDDEHTIEDEMTARGFNPKSYYGLNQYMLGRFFKRTKDPVAQALRDYLISRAVLERRMILQVRDPNRQKAEKKKIKPAAVSGFIQATYLLPGKTQ